MKYYKPLLGISLITAILITGCTRNTSAQTIKEEQSLTNDLREVSLKKLKVDDEKAYIEYDENIWKVAEINNKEILQVKDEEAICFIAVEKINSNIDEETFLQSLKDFLLSNGMDDAITEGTINEYTTLDYTLTQNEKIILHNKIMVVKGENGYYEATFNCEANNFADYELEVIKVFESFKIVLSQDGEKDEGLISATDMESLDRLAGYNDEAVLQNLSEDGKELIGKWYFKNASLQYRIYNEDYTFIENMNEDASNYIEGTWKYHQSTRLIVHQLTKVIQDGQDIVDTFDTQVLNFQVKNFDKKTLYGIVLEKQGLRTLIKEE